jgi:hypothetical protein
MAKKKEHAHLIKPLIVQDPPAGLYAEPRFWMEGKDMEGFNASFSYGFIKKTGSIHPVKGALVHPYDECLVFAGIDNTDISYLGAEVSVELGEEREEHTLNVPSVIIVPKGMPHGPVTIKKLDKPIVHYHIGLAAAYKAEALPEKAKTKGSKYAHLVKPLGSGFEPVRMSKIAKDPKLLAEFKKEHPEFDMDFGQVGLLGPGNADSLTWLYGTDLEGFEVNFTWGFYTGSGIWHRGGEAHYHPTEEILVFIGLDPDNLEFLGCEQELAMGKEYERHVFDKPTVAVCPSGFPHLPLITRWTDKPYAFIVCCLSGTHDSPWTQEEE